MELRNFTFIHIFLLIIFNIFISAGIMGFSLGFLLNSEDPFEDEPKKPRLANIIAFSFNFLGFYFLLIIVFSFYFTKDGQVVFDAFKRPIKYNEKIEILIFGGIFFVYIFYLYLFFIGLYMQ